MDLADLKPGPTETHDNTEESRDLIDCAEMRCREKALRDSVNRPPSPKSADWFLACSGFARVCQGIL